MVAYEAQILSHLPFGIIKTDAQGRILYGNEKVLNYFKKTADVILHQPIHQLLPMSGIIKAMKTQSKQITPILTEDRKKWLLIEQPILDENGKTEGLIILIEEATTGELVEVSDEVAQLRYEMESILNLIGELVTITDASGRVMRVNAACEKLMGVKEWEFVGQPVMSLEERMVIDKSSTKLVLQEKRPVTVVQTTKSGKRLIVNGYPIFNEEGELVKVINISKDITEQDKLSSQLIETKRLVNEYEAELGRLRQEDRQPLVVKSKVMEEIYDLAGRIAHVESTVLILGESGVGKEVLARTIHQRSSRRDGTFMKINCGAIPENLMESELFGYAKGTFTGGNREGKTGLIVNAHKGTLFLDEIGEMPLHLQVKILQVLQEKQVTPLGKTTPIDVDVRFVAATNRNLEEMVEKGLFREDLYYRLNVIPITIPSLRERKEDIPFLINHFLQMYNRKYGKHACMDQLSLQICVDYPWPGNVRELQNVVERLVVTGSEPMITAQLLPENMKRSIRITPSTDTFSLKQAVDEYEKSLLLKTLKQARTMKEASRRLGVDISTISRKIKKYQIEFAELQ